ncbi:unnamed protein product [Angiostrongylus costaricensis]|uniref:Fe2OG dioxygenase domain-containing protein n=1 Tax=Angiostrongylus costaricensis TaxID=334426 RepID=A0A0R3PDF9_ANGCS|nr:unnamed protein product [Angiostrongylus costaricensis]
MLGLENPSSNSDCITLCSQQLVSSCVGSVELEELGLKPLAEWRLITIKGKPGFYILPNLLRNLYFRNVLKEAGKSLRWTTLGVAYNWETKQYPQTGDQLPVELVHFAKVITQVLGLGVMNADAAIVNYYPPKSTLSPHVDRSERTNAPLVSLSLGQSAVYLSGGKSLDDDVVPLWLRSGDVIVMHGAQRFVYHAVAAIVSDRLFAIEDPLLEQFANSSRVNITIRQVNNVQ